MRFSISCLCALLLGQWSPAFAVLGGSPAILQAKNESGAATQTMTSYNGYRISETLEPSGTTIREYILPNNIVFAVSWQGPSMPNLQQLLGSYSDQFIAATVDPRFGRRDVLIQSDQLVLRSGGHMRSFAGSAYVPILLPKGVTADDIR